MSVFVGRKAMKTFRVFSLALLLLGITAAYAGDGTLKKEYKLVPANLTHVGQIFTPKQGGTPCGTYFYQETIFDIGSGRVPSVFFQHEALNGPSIDEGRSLALPGTFRRVVGEGVATATITFTSKSVLTPNDPLDFHWEIKMSKEEWGALDQACPELGKAIQMAE